ncbi:MAG: hypothetical protein KKH68_14860 [Proteobacteria bacterium]|nr:hypothetical protein [Pseudomonadota bacterium]
MKIAFIHYHLKTGGVTTVLNQQLEATIDTCEVLVLTGTLPETPFPCDTVQIPGLGYDRSDQKLSNPEDVATAVIKAIQSKWKNNCNLIHVHNPTLAKNRNFLKILKLLQEKDIKLFLQIHDFAEDGRPLAYFPDDDYVADCHYGVINSRDYNIMLKAGLKKEGLHKITNAIRPLDVNLSAISPSNRVLYPIRAIRRKNIGEAILLSLFFNNNETLAITLPPNSPADQKSYAGWKAFVKEKNLNVAFEVGLIHDFFELVRSSKFIITTSIAEGFGFSFLEPWTARKILWGRKLPEICRDFETNGILLDHLYLRISVPLEWLGKEKLFKTWRACVRKIAAMFNFNIHESAIFNAFENATANDTIDFGLLNEAFQRTIISRILSDFKNRDRLMDLNPFLATPGAVSNGDVLIENNRQAVLQHYSPPIYRKNLLRIYRRVITDNVRQRIDKTVLISEFLDLENFSLLKWDDYV